MRVSQAPFVQTIAMSKSATQPIFLQWAGLANLPVTRGNSPSSGLFFESSSSAVWFEDWRAASSAPLTLRTVAIDEGIDFWPKIHDFCFKTFSFYFKTLTMICRETSTAWFFARKDLCLERWKITSRAGRSKNHPAGIVYGVIFLSSQMQLKAPTLSPKTCALSVIRKISLLSNTHIS